LRIAVVNWTRRLTGGAETVMATQVEHLAGPGHDGALWCETDRPSDRPTLRLADGPTWCAEHLGTTRAIASLREWGPDVTLAHGLLDPTIERSLIVFAPGVFLAYSCHGTCVSGNKTFRFPQTRDLRPNWILLDVEGFEIATLNGGRMTLTSPAARLAVEMHPSVWRLSGTTRAAAETPFRELGVIPVPLSGQDNPFTVHGLVHLAPVVEA